MSALEKRYFLISLYRSKVLLQSEGSRTLLRYFWWVLDPLLDMCLFYVVFGIMLQRGGPEFAASLLTGVIVARFFILATSPAPDLLIHNEHVLLTVYLPKHVFSVAHILTCLVKYLLLLAILIVFLIFLGVPVTPRWLLLLPVTFFYSALTLGCVMILSGITPFFPDFSQLFPKLSMLLYWGSGVFFKPEDIIPGKYLSLFYVNPFAAYIRVYRECLLGGQIEWFFWGGLAVASVLALGAGYCLLARYDRQYPRVIAQE